MESMRAMVSLAASIAMFAPALAGANPVPAAEASKPGLTEPRYLYNLSNLTGPVASSLSTLWFDATNREVYAVTGDTIRVFNGTGLETFSFPISREHGGALAVATLGNGDIAAVSSSLRNGLVRYSFRGEPLGRIEFTGVPAGALEGFNPDAIAVSNGKLYVADRMRLRVIVLDESGAYQRSWDLAPLLKLEGRKRLENAMTGFSVDGQGNILFSVATLFQAFVLSPDGTLRGFGSRGNGPGKFNLVGPIAADEDGRVVVLDVLKAAVIVFDRNLEFLVEFGGRGWDRAGFIGPTDMVVGGGKAFVSQSAKRGVSVYRYSDGIARPSKDVAVAAIGSAGELSEVAVHPAPQQSQAAQ